MQQSFLANYGLFHSVFGSLDVAVDLGIGKFLRLTAHETHLLTTGVDFGRRLQLLIGLAEHHNHPNKKAIISALKKIQDEAKRNAFAHSFLSSDETTVTFIYRHRERPLEAKRYKFTGPEFQKHVYAFIEAAQAYQTALGVTGEEYRDFADAVIKEANSETTSPVPPSAKT